MTDAGGALILVSAERARDFPQSLPLAVNRGPVYLLGTGESVETPMVSQIADFTRSRAFPVAGPKPFAEAGTPHNDVDHLMIYGAPCSLPGASFAHLPIYGLSGSLPPGGCYARRWEAPASPRGTNRDPPTCQFSRIPEQGHESRTALSVRKQTNRLSHLFSVVCEQADLVARKTRFVPRHGRRRASRRLAVLS